MLFLDKQQALEFIRDRRPLFDAAGQANPFAGSAWMLAFIEHVADDRARVAIPQCGRDGESLMLLHLPREGARQPAALANCYASLYSPLISSARDRASAADRLVQELADCRPAWEAIRLFPLEADSPDTRALAQALAKRGWYVRRYFCFGNWYLPCGGLSFAEYMAGRDSRLHNTWVRKARKFQGGGPGKPRLEIVTDPERLEAAWPAYERVYGRSWKTPEGYPGFIRAWARTCARNGWLRLGLAWVDEVPIAAQFWFTLHGRANIFKLAYDEDYARWSAGTVLTAHLLRHSLDEDRVAEIDYLTGDDPYKRAWMKHRRERIGLLACNPRTVRGLRLAAAGMAGMAYRRLRHFIRSGNGPDRGPGRGPGIPISP